MPQSSLMAWLSQPAAVSQRSAAQLKSVQEDERSRKACLPTPPYPGIERLPQPILPTEINGRPFVLTGSEEHPLPPNAQLTACTKEDIPALKRITSLLLPIPYPDRFFKEILDDEVTRNITLVALWYDAPKIKNGVLLNDRADSKVVGAIRCRLFGHPPFLDPVTLKNGRNKEGPMLYLSTLVLLSPYRSHGIAAHMLDVLTKRAVEDYGISSVGAHVWEANAEGLEWYRKRGFTEVGREAGYYRRLKPQGAVVVRKDIGVADLLPC